uniref:Uncharacterized protein n=1 Tax=viral metagenome TaxID=1070528 RepID=A0A6H1ZF60_9ZZZZ
MAVPTVTIGNPTKKSDYDDLVSWVHANKLARDGQVPATGVMQWDKGADVASAGTLVLGNDGNYFDITGTTGITAISQQDVGAVNVQAGTVVKLHFNGACPITHNATSLPLPGKANITTAAGDELEFICLDATNQYWRCTNYSPANGIDHDALLNFVANEHLLPAAIDHDALLNFVANEHLLPAAIDHDALLNFVANKHLLPAAINHDALLNFVANEHLPGIDEDNMVSNSAVHVPVQQSVKAYVDAAIAGAGRALRYKCYLSDRSLNYGTNTWISIEFNTEAVDEIGCTFSGYGVVVPAGIYLVLLNVLWLNFAANSYAWAGIYQNATMMQQSWGHSGGLTVYVGTRCYTVLSCAANDVIYGKIYQNASTSADLEGGVANETSMEIIKIG